MLRKTLCLDEKILDVFEKFMKMWLFFKKLFHFFFKEILYQLTPSKFSFTVYCRWSLIHFRRMPHEKRKYWIFLSKLCRINFFDSHSETGLILVRKKRRRTRFIAHIIWSIFGILADLQSSSKYFGTLQSFSTRFIRYK